jgi:hypothetical protein
MADFPFQMKIGYRFIAPQNKKAAGGCACGFCLFLIITGSADHRRTSAAIKIKTAISRAVDCSAVHCEDCLSTQLSCT